MTPSQSGWLEFSRQIQAGKVKSTDVLLTVHLQSGAKHPVCRAKKESNSSCFRLSVTFYYWKHKCLKDKTESGQAGTKKDKILKTDV